MNGLVGAAIVTGIAAIITSAIAIWNQRKEINGRNRAEQTVAAVEAEVDKTKIVVGEWQKLYEVLNSQVRELRVEIAECDREREDLKHQVDRLEWKVQRLEAQ